MTDLTDLNLKFITVKERKYVIKRDISDRLQSLAQQFPAVAILGPRQSGKTTLAQSIFSNYIYFSFEEIGNRQLVLSDPKSFLEQYIKILQRCFLAQQVHQWRILL